jgi:hypothetical protein
MKKPVLKIFSLTLVVIAMINFQACDEIKDATTQTITVDGGTHEFTIDSIAFNTNKATQSYETVFESTIDINLVQTLEDNGFSTDMLTAGSVTSVELTIINPENANLSFFTAARFSVGSGADDMEVVAETTNVDPAAQSVTFEIYETNILTYLETNPLHIKLELDGSASLPAETVVMALSPDFEVNVEIF